MKHSNVVGGSTAKRVIACPGSVALVQRMPPQIESEHAATGTLLHEAITHILTSEVTLQGAIGRTFGGKIELTQDHVDEKLVPALRLLDEIDPEGDMLIKTEERVEIRPGIFGSADIIGNLYGKGYVIDWKFGDGVAVAAEENEQLMFYACGAMKKFPELFPGDEIELAIIQPPYLRRWTTTKARIVEFERTLLRAVELAESDDAPIASGDHCRWCTAKPICPEMNGAAERALRAKLEAIPIAEAMTRVPLLKSWIADVESLAQRMLENNVPVPGFKLVPKRASRVWADAAQARADLLAQGVQESEIIELRSVAQIEKVLKKRKLKLPEVVSVSSGNTVAPESDPRTAVLNLGAALSKLR